VAIDSVAVTASGAIESLQADAGVRGEMGALDLSATVGRRQELWQGALRSLRLAPARGAAWNLQSPADFAQTAAGWRVSQSCFASTVGGALCVAADWPRTGLTVSGNALPLALVEAW